jgi:hypothetical protein
MIFKISPLELFIETCFTCRHYKIAKKYLKNQKLTDEVQEICFKCFLGDYSNYRSDIKHKRTLSERVYLKESLDYKAGDRIIIGVGQHPRYLRYAVIDRLGIEYDASVIREIDGVDLVVNLLKTIKVRDDGLDDRERLLKLYNKYFPGKWKEDQDFKYNLWIDECLSKKNNNEN